MCEKLPKMALPTVPEVPFRCRKTCAGSRVGAQPLHMSRHLFACTTKNVFIRKFGQVNSFEGGVTFENFCFENFRCVMGEGRGAQVRNASVGYPFGAEA